MNGGSKLDTEANHIEGTTEVVRWRLLTWAATMGREVGHQRSPKIMSLRRLVATQKYADKALAAPLHDPVICYRLSTSKGYTGISPIQ